MADIVHERLALAHTHIPDLVFASFETLLNSRGTLHSEAATYYHLMHPEQFNEITVQDGRTVRITAEYSQQRRLALAIGSMMLRMQGFSYSTDSKQHAGIFERITETSRSV